jgi:hypothetical protein
MQYSPFHYLPMATKYIIFGVIMRLREIFNQPLLEVNMSPSGLQRAAANIDALCGIEFEMILNADIDGDIDMGEYRLDPDFSENYEFEEDADILSEVRAFIHENRFSEFIDATADDAVRLVKTAYQNDIIVDFIKPAYTKIRTKELSNTTATLPDKTHAIMAAITSELADRSADSRYSRFIIDNIDHYSSEYPMHEWATDNDIQSMARLLSHVGIPWPIYTEVSISEPSVDLEKVAQQLSKKLKREVDIYSGHNTRQKSLSNYTLESDGSIVPSHSSGGSGIELVSPPMSVDQMMKDFYTIAVWMNNNGHYTNSSTGLHINISLPNIDTSRIDYVKLAILLGDDYVAKLYNRFENTYARSSIQKILQRISLLPNPAAQLELIKKGMITDASATIHSGRTDKYVSINMQANRVEFRSPGGNWLTAYNESRSKIFNTILRMVVALDAACDPAKYRNEYMTKLYKLVASTMPDMPSDNIRLFAEYTAGKINVSELKQRWAEEAVGTSAALSAKRQALATKIAANLPNAASEEDLNHLFGR